MTERKGPEVRLRGVTIERQTLLDRAVEVVRQSIQSGELPPGTRLVEARLAEQIGLSRGTIRSALRELVHEGLVQAVPYTGWAVSEISIEDARELCELRAALEGLAARLAAERITPEGVKVLDRAYDSLRKAAEAGSGRRVVTADIELHRIILRLAGNRRLAEQYESIGRQLQMYVAFSDLRSEMGEVVTWHDELLDAIKTGDAPRAERAAVKNIERNGTELLRMLEDYEVQKTATETSRRAAP